MILRHAPRGSLIAHPTQECPQLPRGPPTLLSQVHPPRGMEGGGQEEPLHPPTPEMALLSTKVQPLAATFFLLCLALEGNAPGPIAASSQMLPHPLPQVPGCRSAWAFHLRELPEVPDPW